MSGPTKHFYGLKNEKNYSQQSLDLWGNGYKIGVGVTESSKVGINFYFTGNCEITSVYKM